MIFNHDFLKGLILTQILVLKYQYLVQMIQPMMQMMKVQHSFPQLAFAKKTLLVGYGHKAKRGNS